MPPMLNWLWQSTTALTLRIIDDGQGGVIQEGAGIRGMRERALLIGAQLTVSWGRRRRSSKFVAVAESVEGEPGFDRGELPAGGHHLARDLTTTTPTTTPQRHATACR